ncbi:MAG: hypothetical protein BroJett025_01470 [Patescibacteria group bacterium]|nr:MAG: hypothetical protein BroJett025_01470 [Patescibacteria group bacterium]
MTYLASTILQHASDHNAFEAVSLWLNKPITNQANIILINETGESIKIETVREIKEKLAYASYVANQPRYFIFLDAHLLTIPAQNALLKAIEEPPKDTQLIFVTATPEKLLETIRSRCQTVFITNPHTQQADVQQKTEKITELLGEIIASNPGHKITLAAAYKEREDALIFCNQLVQFLHKQLQNQDSLTSKKTRQITQNLKAVLKTIEYLEHNTNVLLTMENCFFELN